MCLGDESPEVALSAAEPEADPELAPVDGALLHRERRQQFGGGNTYYSNHRLT